MRTVIVRDAMRIPLGKQGENKAVRVVWPEIADKYAKLYGDGRFELVVVQKGKAYNAVVNVDGADLVWDVLAAHIATAEVGSLELIYYVGDTIAKSQTWETIVVASKSADGATEPPEDPARAWFDEIKRQIGDLSKLTTKAKENLVAAINEAARTGSGGGTVEMRVNGGYIQYSTDGVTWENLIAVADLEGKPGKDGEPGAPGKDGEPGKDGHTPKIAATKTGKTTSITADGVEIAQIKDGEDAASDLSLGITGATVGQIAKITAVDTDGKPTAWEPVEMAGGETKPYKILYNQTLSEAAVVKVDADADAAACNEYILSMAIPKGDVAVAYNRYTTILCVADCVNNVRVVDASFGTLHQARMLKSDDGGAWIDFFSSQTTIATPNLNWVPRTGWGNPVRCKMTDLSPILYDSKVELPAGTIIIIGGR